MVVAHGVLCAVYRQKFLALRAAGFIVALPHIIGYKAVRVAVDKQNRHLALRCGGLAVGVLGVKVAEQDRAQPSNRIGQLQRHAGQILRQALAGDLPRAGVAAVRHNAADVVRQVQPGGQQHGGRPHRDAHQKDRHLGAEVAPRPDRPVAGVVALLHAHRNRMAAAVAVGALVGQQHIVAQRRTQRIAAQAVPLRIAAVAVEDDCQRRAVGVVVVACGQRRTVLRRDVHGLEHIPRQRVGVGAHGLAVALPRGHIRRGGHLRRRLLVKGNAVDGIRRAQHRRARRGPCRQKRMLFHNGHLVFTFPDYNKFPGISQRCTKKVYTCQRGTFAV